MTTIHHGDCIETMNAMPPESVDAIVTDPPYGLGFMGKKWDGLPPSLEWAEACYRVLKPGGHIAAFGGTRTWHRLAVAIEDAGFEMRDSLAWLYGSGFPKSMNVGKAIASGEWEGWGTALKPAFEPIVLARKPLAEKTVARNVLAHGTGAINVDGCRIGTTVETWPATRSYGGDPSEVSFTKTAGGVRRAQSTGSAPSGRWPANVLLDQHAAAWLDEQTPNLGRAVTVNRARKDGEWQGNQVYGKFNSVRGEDQTYGDSGGASRFFKVAESDDHGAISPYFPREFDDAFLYTAKAPRSERPNVDGVQHPTVKPLAIMRWLIRLITPSGGTVLDPFAGSGTTIEAALIESFTPVGIKMEADYLPLIQHRIDRATPHPTHASETA